MTNEEYILDWFKNHVWSRIKPSNVCDGVGIFAIRDIPKGTSVHDKAPKTVNAWIPYETVVETLPMGVVDMIISAQPSVGSKLCDSDFVWKEEYGPLWMYTNQNMNWINYWWHQNHSDNPNLDVFVMGDREFKYISNRDIKEGDELFESYDRSGDGWEKINKNGKSS
tara:strand:- start:307 stop:807 length:501 start_codon:yes stop_codon:yes gene_type:complete